MILSYTFSDPKNDLIYEENNTNNYNESNKIRLLFKTKFLE